MNEEQVIKAHIESSPLVKAELTILLNDLLRLADEAMEAYTPEEGQRIRRLLAARSALITRLGITIIKTVEQRQEAERELYMATTAYRIMQEEERENE